MKQLPRIDQALSQATEAGEVAGVVAAATVRGEPFYEGAFGRREIDKPAAMTVDTVFWIASMTKAITAAGAMQQVEEGKLALDAPISDVLPQLRSPQVFEGFDGSGKAKLRPAKRAITLRHLLTHTAGFSYDIWNADLGKYMEQNGIPGIITCQDAALSTPLTFDPGERWDYGISIDWAGKAVEAVSGKRLDSYLRDRIFAPLGMVDTSFALRADQRARLAAMHARGADGTLQAIPFELPPEPEFFMGGGGLYGTARDYLRFLNMILRGGTIDNVQILKRETVREMTQNNIGGITVETLKTAMPAFSNDANLFPGMVQNWGLSFCINTEQGPHGRSPGSLAWAGLANTYFWADPLHNVAGTIMTQTLPFADAKVLDLFGRLERGIYDAL
jgi:CubicO group peptidase (beta-lactamase class C family)